VDDHDQRQRDIEYLTRIRERIALAETSNYGAIRDLDADKPEIDAVLHRVLGREPAYSTRGPLPPVDFTGRSTRPQTRHWWELAALVDEAVAKVG
jgi:hypothetical protein